jgi:hypothetical protein
VIHRTLSTHRNIRLIPIVEFSLEVGKDGSVTVREEEDGVTDLIPTKGGKGTGKSGGGSTARSAGAAELESGTLSPLAATTATPATATPPRRDPRRRTFGAWLWFFFILLATPLAMLSQGVRVTGSWLSYVVKRRRSHSFAGRHVAKLLGAVWIALLLYAAAYGARTVLAVCGYDVECVRALPMVVRVTLGISKSFAMLQIPAFGFLVLVVAKPTVDFIEGSTLNRYLPLSSWRRLHVSLGFISFACGTVHAVSHGVRRLQANPFIIGSLAYENWELVTGLALVLLFTAMAVQYFLLKSEHTAAPFNFAAKRYFRLTHRTAAFLTGVLLTVHAWRLTPLITLTFIYGAYAYSTILVRDVHVRVLQGRHFVSTVDETAPYVVELFFTSDSIVPQSFGYYVTLTLKRAGAFGSYTIIPVDEDGFMVQIAPSVLSTALLPYLETALCGRVSERYDRRSGSWIRDGDRGTWHRLHPRDLPLTVSGFFNSFDMTFGNKRNLICFVRSTGRAVTDAVLTFHDSFRAYDSVLIVHQSRKIYSHYSATISSHSARSRIVADEIAPVAAAAAAAPDADGDTPLGKHVVAYARAARAAAADARARRVRGSPAQVVIVNVSGEIAEADLAGILDSMLDLDDTRQRPATEVLVVSAAMSEQTVNIFDEREQDRRFDRSCLHMEEFGM